MICVNFYGGAGIGKSTLAAEVFSELKKLGIKTELAGEYAKELSYERAYNIMHDQLYLFAEQAHRLLMFKEYGVQVAVCDSPLLLNIAYADSATSPVLKDLIVDTYNRYDNIDMFLERREDYWIKDHRDGDINSAILMDKKILQILNKYSNNLLSRTFAGTPEWLAKEINSLIAVKNIPSDNMTESNKLYTSEPWRSYTKEDDFDGM